MPITTSDAYRSKNTEQTKQVVLVVKIEGVDAPFLTEVAATYGGDIVYGEAGLVYGGLSGFESTGYRPILSLQGSSLTISQKLEPEQGRASVTNLTLSFIDKDSYMTRLCSPGVIITDILGSAVEVFLGYKGLTYPEDYLRVFRGYVSNYSYQCGLYTLQLSDPNLKRRQELFISKTSTLASGIDAVTTTIPLTSSGGFYQAITRPGGGFDVATSFYIKVEDEFIQYLSISGNDLILCTRGARGTVAAAHSAGADVTLYAQIEDHCIDMALKLMLSGWGGPFETGVTIQDIGNIPGVGAVSGAISFPAGVNLKNDYGLSDGDWITISGALNPANNGDWQIVAFREAEGEQNRVAIISGSLTLETSTPALADFRSNYDTYPVSMGLKLTPKDVDVEQHKFMKRTWVTSSDYSYRFLISGAESSGKTFIENQIYLPFGMYSLTKRGLLSVGITKPPIGDQTLYVLDQNNILNGDQIRVTRATNMRKFFNQITVQYDLSDSDVYATVFSTIDTNSLNEIGVKSTLPITSNGARTDLGTDTILQRQANLLLSRYRKGAVQISLQVDWGTGNMIEAGDVVAIRDDGTLQIANWSTGQRDIGFELYEVEDRRLDIATGRVNLSLISNVGGQATDRYGFISPSSLIASATAFGETITIMDSYGAVYPGDEPRKWVDYVGLPVYVHNEDYSVSGTSILQSIDPTNPYVFTLSPPLSFTPASGYILDIPYYSNSTDPVVDAAYKNTFCHFDPQVQVVSGTSQTVFDVSPGDASKFFAGSIIRVHTDTYSQDSGDIEVLSVSGTTITTKTAIGFIPSSSHYVDLIGFSADRGAAYRIIA